MTLTPHFTLEELTRTAVRLPNYPSQAEIEKLRAVAELLEVIREHFGAPVVVHSGYRSAAVNARVGGSKTSQHCRAEAADFHVSGVDLVDVWTWIGWSSGLRFGQLILEGADPARPTWIHLSVPGDRPPEKCGQVMRWSKSTGYTMVHRATV